MYFEKNKLKELDINLFKNPTKEYRSAPFWAWNAKLEKDVLERQIECFKKMGFGGFDMHVRTGLDTEYLSDEFLDCVKFCVKKAESVGLNAWLYDEDKYPSGFCGGQVSKDMKYRYRQLLFTTKMRDDTTDFEDYCENGGSFLLGCYDIVLNSDGELISYDLISENCEAKGTKWFAFATTAPSVQWFNGQSYIDVMNKDAVDRFIELTHEKYKNAVGEKFGKSVPYIFTDEPSANFVTEVPGEIYQLARSTDKTDIFMPWSKNFANEYFARYNEEVTPLLPELFWEKADKSISKIRYNYHNLITDLLCNNFAKTYSDWCSKNNLGFTGHYMNEDTLYMQTVGFGGESMRAYKYFDIPGVDVLMADKFFTVLKQAQSVVRQMGKEGMLSELYGVTGWDFDFRGHKFEGDWQAALGVTHRVHHLSWLSMEGEAKRDYPASINYQSPWYEEYSYIEDHFARLNTVLTRGKALVNVAVIHPIESFWLKVGPKDKTDMATKTMDNNFALLADWLVHGNIDFDYICESMLPELCENGDAPLKVGEMKYNTVIVPEVLTLRKTTYDRLKAFKEAGGKLVFIGNCPKYLDLIESDEIKALYDASIKTPFDQNEILALLKEDAVIEITNADGDKNDDIIYQLREDGDVKWLFLAHTKVPACVDTVPSEERIIRVKGEYIPAIYDTVSGEIVSADYYNKDGDTYIEKTLYAYDSLLIKLSDKNEVLSTKKPQNFKAFKKSDFKREVPFKLSENNALLIDRAEYSLDGGEFEEQEDMLRINYNLREKLGLPLSGVYTLQPYLLSNKKPDHLLTLKMHIFSDIPVENALLAIERPDDAEIIFNGKKITEKVGFFVDEAIKTLKLPKIKKGENILTVKMPFGERTFPEWCYILGNFCVRVAGATAYITKMPEKVGFSSITEQNLGFYSGNIIYKTEIDVPECDNVKVNVSRYRGGLVKVFVDGKVSGKIVYPPYNLDLGKLSEGKHTLEFKLYGNRHNAFGQLHATDFSNRWIGPDLWLTQDDKYSYEYNFKPMGILKSPVIFFENKEEVY